MSAITFGVAAVGTLLSGLFLAIWILKRRKKGRYTFELSRFDEEQPPTMWRLVELYCKAKKKKKLYLTTTQKNRVLFFTAVMCFFRWPCHSQRSSVRSWLVLKEDPCLASLLWAPLGTSPPVCLPVTRATSKLVPPLTLCSVRHQDVGMPRSRLVLVRSHIYLIASFVCFNKGKAVWL